MEEGYELKLHQVPNQPPTTSLKYTESKLEIKCVSPVTNLTELDVLGPSRPQLLSDLYVHVQWTLSMFG